MAAAPFTANGIETGLRKTEVGSGLPKAVEKGSESKGLNAFGRIELFELMEPIEAIRKIQQRQLTNKTNRTNLTNSTKRITSHLNTGECTGTALDGAEQEASR